MKHLIAITAAAMLVAGSAAHSQDTQKIAAAEAAALAWLALTDQGDFALSWDQAAGAFRTSISQADWVSRVGAVRVPLGKLISRHVRAATFAHSLPQVPDGDYVVIEFETQFEYLDKAIETITPMLDKDGSWKVSGYYIRRSPASSTGSH